MQAFNGMDSYLAGDEAYTAPHLLMGYLDTLCVQDENKYYHL